MSDSRYRRRAPTPVALLGASLQVGFATGRLVVRPVIACVGAGLRIEREARSAIGDAIGRSVLDAIDSVLATPYAEEAVDRVLAAPIAERALERALSGPLVEALARDVVRYAVVERVAEAVFTGDTLDRLMVLALDGPGAERVVVATLESPAAERAIAAALESPALERLVAQAIDDPGLERIVARAVESPGGERILARVVDSRLTDAAVERLLDSEDLWHMVDEIASSPAVTEAITQQSLGFADQMAGEVRQRSRRVDARLERLARHLVRRGSRGDQAGPTLPEPGAT